MLCPMPPVVRKIPQEAGCQENHCALQKDIDKALKEGFKAYIIKPINPVEFLRVIEMTLNAKHGEKEP